MRFFGRGNANNNNNASAQPTGNVPMIDFREGALMDCPQVVTVSPDADTARKLQEMASRVEEIQRQNEELERKLAVRTKDLEKKISTASSSAPPSSSYPHAMMANAAAAHYNQARSQEVMHKIGRLETCALPTLGRAAARDHKADDDLQGEEHEDAGRAATAASNAFRKDRIDEWMNERVRLEQLRRARDRVMVGGGGAGGGVGGI